MSSVITAAVVFTAVTTTMSIHSASMQRKSQKSALEAQQDAVKRAEDRAAKAKEDAAKHAEDKLRKFRKAQTKTILTTPLGIPAEDGSKLGTKQLV